MVLEVVVLRSDRHLREVLKSSERKYNSNFAKECLKKSNNLVVSRTRRKAGNMS